MNFRVQVFDRAGKFQYAIGKIGDSTGAMFRPKAVSVDSEGDLYVVDALWGVVQVFNRQGQLLYYFGAKGTHAGEFQLPSGLFIDHDDKVFVVDSFNRRIQVFQYVGLKNPVQGGSEVRIRILLAALTILLTGTTSVCADHRRRMGVHNLGPGSKSPITGARPDSCAYCHAPHSGLNTGLWNQKLTTQTYTTYGSNTEKNNVTQPMLGSDSNQCLSCHDGTVAVGATVAYGQVTTRGSMNTADVFGSNMQSSHPFSLALPLKDNVDLVASLAANG